MVMKIFSTTPYYQQQILGIVRIIVACLLIFHGMETFNEEKMTMYTGWFAERKYGQPAWWAYAGKISELLIGIGYLLGFLTRLASLGMILTFGSIIFLLGDKGNVFEGDQHPFMFVLIGIIFIANGPGAWSVDRVIEKRSRGPKVQRSKGNSQ
jgi:uncharacterized membrane protein YphA (DoxX/SURF4 family)